MNVARVLLLAAVAAAVSLAQGNPVADSTRPRARDLGIRPGIYEPGPFNAITDVSGVAVGQVTIIEGTDVHTGVTAILPHTGNLFREKVAGAVHIFNAFGKIVGAAQVNELGQIETPILLTNTLSVWDAAAAMTSWMLARPGNENVRSINPVVGETNDGYLNDIRGRHVKPEHVRQALESARSGPVEEGALGAGTGTSALGWKGGIGTSSRRLPGNEGGYTLGVLVQTNFGGHLTLDGVPVWKDLKAPERARANPPEEKQDSTGSCMIVVATDAPLDARELRRLAARAVYGMARAGGDGSHGSGDFVIAFSTTNRITAEPRSPAAGSAGVVAEDALSPLFAATIEATEEAIYNSLLRATTTRGKNGAVVEAIPIEPLRALLRRYGR
jgi:D-aminopeptidase